MAVESVREILRKYRHRRKIRGGECVPNLRGANPVGRDDGDLLYATRMVSRVLRFDYFGVVKVDGGAERSGGSRVNQRRRLDLGREKLTGSQGVQWRDEALAAGRAGRHVEERRVTQRDDVGRFRSAAVTGGWTMAAAECVGYAEQGESRPPDGMENAVDSVGSWR